MFETYIGAYIRHLTNLKNILEKAKAWQSQMKIKDEAVMNARLALDQFHFAMQVRGTTNFARQSAAAMFNIEYPKFEDNETNLTELQSRIDKSIEYLSSCKDKAIATDLETRVVPLPWMPGKGFITKYFIEVYAHDNFYFHCTTAYSILRHYGLQIGKSDFMGDIELKDLPE